MYRFKYAINETNINKSNYQNNSIRIKEREELLKYISMGIHKNISQIKSIFLDLKFRLGNQLIFLNKVIFYCEILGCKRIILNKDYYWFIRHKIFYKKYRMFIIPGDLKKYNNYNILIDKSTNFFWYSNYIKPQYKTTIIKREILRNLPKIKVNSYDLFIYIRSGDIFEKFLNSYFQPPLCFYKHILNNFGFKNIYLISEKLNNPVIIKLLNLYPNIIFNQNSLLLDISYLAFGINIVGAYSTLLFNIIRFNTYLKIFFFFEFSENFFFSFEFNERNKSIFKMKASDYYYKISKFKTLKSQAELMINYNCKYNLSTNNYC